MAEEIKIGIKTTYDDAAAKKALDDEKKLQQGGSGSGASSGASAARAAETKHSEKRLETEKSITKEIGKQMDAVAKARGGHGGDHGGGQMNWWRTGGELADMAGGQGMVMKAMQVRNLMHMITAGGMMGTIGALIAAPIAGYAAGMALKISQGDQQVALRNEDREQRNATSRRLERMGRFGSSEEAFSAQLDFQEHLGDLKDQHSTLVDKANSGVIGHAAKFFGSTFFTKGNSFFTPESALELQRNEMAQQRDKDAMEKAAKVKEEWWGKIGKRELEISKAQAHGDMARARGIQDELTAVEEAKRLEKAGASAEEIHEGVVAKLQNIQRERAGQLAGLVTARDGAADTAAVAREAMSFRSLGGAEAVLERMHNTMMKQHTEALSAIVRKDHTKR